MPEFTVTIVHTLDPAVLNILNDLLNHSTPKAASAAQPIKQPVPSVVADPPADPATSTDEPPTACFDEVHKALLDLKAKQKAPAVREVLLSFDCKTVQDIPEDKYAAVLQAVQKKLEG